MQKNALIISVQFNELAQKEQTLVTTNQIKKQNYCILKSPPGYHSLVLPLSGLQRNGII